MEAEQYYWKLLNRNPENVGYYHKLEKSIQPSMHFDHTVFYNSITKKDNDGSIKIFLVISSASYFQNQPKNFT